MAALRTNEFNAMMSEQAGQKGLRIRMYARKLISSLGGVPAVTVRHGKVRVTRERILHLIDWSEPTKTYTAARGVCRGSIVANFEGSFLRLHGSAEAEFPARAVGTTRTLHLSFMNHPFRV